MPPDALRCLPPPPVQLVLAAGSLPYSLVRREEALLASSPGKHSQEVSREMLLGPLLLILQPLLGDSPGHRVELSESLPAWQ